MIESLFWFAVGAFLLALGIGIGAWIRDEWHDLKVRRMLDEWRDAD